MRSRDVRGGHRNAIVDREFVRCRIPGPPIARIARGAMVLVRPAGGGRLCLALLHA